MAVGWDTRLRNAVASIGPRGRRTTTPVALPPCPSAMARRALRTTVGSVHEIAINGVGYMLADHPEREMRYRRRVVPLDDLRSLLTFVAWSMIATPNIGAEHAMALLIVTCPCALSLATPAALAAATGSLARRGLLVTRGHALEALAQRLVEVGELEAAVACATDEAVAGARDPAVLAGLGMLMNGQALPAVALPLLERARHLGGDAPPLLREIGLARTYLGDTDGAERALQACLAAAPDAAQAWRDLARLRRWTPERQPPRWTPTRRVRCFHCTTGSGAG